MCDRQANWRGPGSFCGRVGGGYRTMNAFCVTDKLIGEGLVHSVAVLVAGIKP